MPCIRPVTLADCSECSLEYKPVLHKRTGVPFYNRCLAYCQLGEEEPVEETGAEAVTARAGAESNKTDPQRSEIAKHVKRLLPPPFDANGEARHGSKWTCYSFRTSHAPPLPCNTCSLLNTPTSSPSNRTGAPPMPSCAPRYFPQAPDPRRCGPLQP